jgi:hypothetical protein
MRWQEVGELHNEELHNFYSLPSIIKTIKSRWMMWTRHEARMGTNRNAYRTLVGKPEGQRPLGNQEVSGWIILKSIVERYCRVVWTGWIWLRLGTSGGLL